MRMETKQELFLTRSEMKKLLDLTNKVECANTVIEVKIYRRQIQEIINKAKDRQETQRKGTQHKNKHALA